MAIFRKYEFGSQSAATTKINALGVDEEGNPTHRHSVVRLGNIVTTPAYMDAKNISEAADGIEKLVKQIILMVK